jgi:hypothetical protein
MMAQTLAYIQRMTGQFQSETCTIQELTPVPNRIGVMGKSFSTVASNVRCRVITERGTSATTAEQVASREALVDGYRISLPAGTVIGHDYRIIVGDDTYDVVGVLDDRTDENEIQVRVTKVR